MNTWNTFIVHRHSWNAPQYEVDALGTRHCKHQYATIGGTMNWPPNSGPKICKWCGHEQGDVDTHECFWEESVEGSDLLVCRTCEAAKWRWELAPKAVSYEQ